MIIEIPLKAISQNEFKRLHWTKQSAIKKEFERTVFYLCKANKLQPISEYPVSINFIFGITDKRNHDLDNYAITCKFINDGLIKAGIIKDDGYCYINQITLQAFKSKEQLIKVIIYKDESDSCVA